MHLRVQPTKSWKRNSLAESEKRKEEEQEGPCMNYTFSPQSGVTALFMSEKGPHSLARTVLCLPWNAIAGHLIVNDSEVSPRHPPTERCPCPLLHRPASTRVKITVAVTRVALFTQVWHRFGDDWSLRGVRWVIKRPSRVSIGPIHKKTRHGKVFWIPCRTCPNTEHTMTNVDRCSRIRIVR